MANEATSVSQNNSFRIVSLLNPNGFSPWRELVNGQIAVGGSLTNDIALVGCSNPELFVLTVEQSGYNRKQVTITPFEPGLTVDGRALTVGEPTIIDAPATMLSAEHRIEFSGLVTEAGASIDEPNETSRPGLPVLGSIPGLSGLSLSGGRNLAEGWQSRARGASRLLGAAGFLLFAGFASLGIRAYLNSTGSDIQSLASSNSENQSDVSVERLRLLLVSLDLSPLVKIDEKSGKIRLTGELTEEQAARLKIALTPFGQNVQSRIRFKPNATHGVAGVFLEPRAFVIASNGRLVAQGGLLESGWRVEAISKSGVSLSKNGQSLIATIGEQELATGSIKAQKDSAVWHMRGALKAVN